MRGGYRFADDKIPYPNTSLIEQRREALEQRGIKRANEREARHSNRELHSREGNTPPGHYSNSEQLVRPKDIRSVIPRDWTAYEKYVAPKIRRERDPDLKVEVTKDAETGQVVEFRGPVVVTKNTSAKDLSDAFLKKYHKKFGIAPDLSELRFVRYMEKRPTHGEINKISGVVEYQQVFRGLPVFGGELKVSIIGTDSIIHFKSSIKQITVAPELPKRLDSENAVAAATREVAEGLGINQQDINLIGEPVATLGIEVRDGLPVHVWKTALYFRDYGVFAVRIDALSQEIISIRMQGKS